MRYISFDKRWQLRLFKIVHVRGIQSKVKLHRIKYFFLITRMFKITPTDTNSMIISCSSYGYYYSVVINVSSRGQFIFLRSDRFNFIREGREKERESELFFRTRYRNHYAKWEIDSFSRCDFSFLIETLKYFWFIFQEFISSIIFIIIIRDFHDSVYSEFSRFTSVKKFRKKFENSKLTLQKYLNGQKSL